MMKNRFTKKELEIMKTLWNSDKPLTASDIVKQNESLNINTAQACLRTLIKDKSIKVADIVYSGTVLTRSYSPIIQRAEFLGNISKDIFGKKQSFPLIKSLIESETNLEELEQLEKLIAQKKREIKHKENK